MPSLFPLSSIISHVFVLGNGASVLHIRTGPHSVKDLSACTPFLLADLGDEQTAADLAGDDTVERRGSVDHRPPRSALGAEGVVRGRDMSRPRTGGIAGPYYRSL